MSEWQLNELKIEKLHEWDQKKLGTTKDYAGKISFMNDDGERFYINIPPDRASVIYSLVSDLVAVQANELAERMRAAINPQA